MKTELERVDFGGHPAYHGGSIPTLFPGRSAKFGPSPSNKKQHSSSLFDLNPHKDALGLNLQVCLLLLLLLLAECGWWASKLITAGFRWQQFSTHLTPTSLLFVCPPGLHSLKAVPQAIPCGAAL